MSAATGCSAGDSSVDGVATLLDDAEGAADGPATNEQDFYVQDYNVVNPGVVRKDELEAYDVSGPTYNGITSIGGSSSTSLSQNSTESSVASDNSEQTVAITLYHTSVATVGSNSVTSKNSVIQIFPWTTDEYLSTKFPLKDKVPHFYTWLKEDHSDVLDDANGILRYMQVYASDTTKKYTTERTRIGTFLITQCIRDKSERLSIANLERAYHLSASDDSSAWKYTVESSIGKVVKNGLEHDGKSAALITSVYGGKVNKALTIPEMCNTAANQNLNVVIICGDTPVQYDEVVTMDKQGYLFVLDDDFADETKGIVDSFVRNYTGSVQSAIATAAVKDRDLSGISVYNGKNNNLGYWIVYGDKMRCTFFNYSSVPTVIFWVTSSIANGQEDAIGSALVTAIEEYLNN